MLEGGGTGNAGVGDGVVHAGGRTLSRTGGGWRQLPGRPGAVPGAASQPAALGMICSHRAGQAQHTGKAWGGCWLEVHLGQEASGTQLQPPCRRQAPPPTLCLPALVAGRDGAPAAPGLPAASWVLAQQLGQARGAEAPGWSWRNAARGGGVGERRQAQCSQHGCPLPEYKNRIWSLHGQCRLPLPTRAPRPGRGGSGAASTESHLWLKKKKKKGARPWGCNGQPLNPRVDREVGRAGPGPGAGESTPGSAQEPGRAGS